MSIYRLSTITANTKIWKAYHDYDVGKCSLGSKIKTLLEYGREIVVTPSVPKESKSHNCLALCDVRFPFFYEDNKITYIYS